MADTLHGPLMSIVLPILIGLHILVCILTVLVVLMQRPRSEGLGSAFGGGITDNVFGSQTTNVLTRFTTWMGIAFFAITLLLSILTARAASSKTAIQKTLLASPEPAAAPAASAEPAPSQPAVSTSGTPAAQAPTPEALPPAQDTATPVTEQAAPPPVEAVSPQPVSEQTPPPPQGN